MGDNIIQSIQSNITESHKYLKRKLEEKLFSGNIQPQPKDDTHEDGYYIIKDRDGKLSIELLEFGRWWAYGCEFDFTIQTDEIVAGPLSAEQILKSVSQ